MSALSFAFEGIVAALMVALIVYCIRLERRLADRRGAERIELGGQVPVGAERGDQQHARGDVREELGVHPHARPPDSGGRGGRDGADPSAPLALGAQLLRDLGAEDAV